MAWEKGTIISNAPSLAFSEKLQALCGGEGVANWSYVGRVLAGASAAERQRITMSTFGTGDTFKLTYGAEETASISYSSDISAAIVTALNNLDAFDSGDVTCVKISTSIYDVVFGGTDILGNTHTALSVTSAVGCSGVVEKIANAYVRTGTSDWQADVFKCAGSGDDANLAGVDWHLYLRIPEKNEIQQILIPVASYGAIFTLTFNGHTTSDITKVVTDMSADIQAALEGLEDFVAGDIQVCKTLTNSSYDYYEVTFTGNYANQNVETLVADGASIIVSVTGGSVAPADSAIIYLFASVDYDGGRFKRGVCEPHSSSAYGKADANGYIYMDSYFPANHVTEYHQLVWQSTYVNVIGGSVNWSGFEYYIKLHKDYFMFMCLKGYDPIGGFAGLFDTLVDSGVGLEATPLGDYLPLTVLSPTYGATWATQSFLRLPGVTKTDTGIVALGACFVTTLSDFTVGYLLAPNYQDLWRGGGYPLSRVMLYHRVASSLYYLYGGLRGLLPEDIKQLTGQQANDLKAGDTVTVVHDSVEETWVAMFYMTNSGSTSGWAFVKSE
jgi:hypothetical protein